MRLPGGGGTTNLTTGTKTTTEKTIETCGTNIQYQAWLFVVQMCGTGTPCRLAANGMTAVPV